MRDWRRHVYHRVECVKTTWKFRLGVLLILIIAGASTRNLWVGAIGRSLVCARDAAPSDIILIENFDPEYVLFERAATLERAGLAPRILIPVSVSRTPEIPNLVSAAIADVMARQARIAAWDVVPISETEPISLNAASQIRVRLARERVRSLIVVTPGFRSRRSALIYRAVLGPAGVQVRCDPVMLQGAPEDWAATWHGIQGVIQEFLKLQYYRFYVLPFLLRHDQSS